MAVGGSHITDAWVTLSILRRFHHCRLPLEIWYLNDTDLPLKLRQLFAEFNARFFDASKVAQSTAWRPTTGWELKPFAVTHSRFAEVLFLDADNVPLTDPAFLINDPRYRARGAAFWPDIRAVNPFNPIWTIAGVKTPVGFEFETGLFLIDKRRHWAPLNLTLHLNEHSRFYYRYFLGDKETFHLAWRVLRAEYIQNPTPPVRAFGRDTDHAGPPNRRIGLWQHDFDGKPLTLHFTDTPLVARGRNPSCDGFTLYHAVDAALAELRQAWDGYLHPSPIPGDSGVVPEERSNVRSFIYTRIGLDQRRLDLLPNGRIGEGASSHECLWREETDDHGRFLVLSSRTADTCRLRIQQDGSWRGEWLRYEQPPAELVPIGSRPLLSGQDNRPRLLFITPVVPNEIGNGLAMRASHVLRLLTETHRVFLLIIPLYPGGAAKSTPSWLAESCEQVRFALPPVALSQMQRDPTLGRQIEEAWIDEVVRAYSDETFDTIHCFRLSVVRFALRYLEYSRNAAAYWHLDLDDVESRTSRRLADLYARHGRNDETQQSRRHAAEVELAEHQIMSEWDRVYVCSTEDRRYLEQVFPAHRAEIEVLPNRVSVPAQIAAVPQSVPFTLLYVGTLSYFPNADGVMWFCREVLPIVREKTRVPFRLLLVGYGAGDDVKELEHIPEVEFVGEVPSVDEWYARANAVIVPIRAGGGTRIKLLEALAHERPVVATRMAAEGLDLVDEQELLIADRPEQFAHQCVRLIGDDRLARRLAEKGRAAVVRDYSLSPGSALTGAER